MFVIVAKGEPGLGEPGGVVDIIGGGVDQIAIAIALGAEGAAGVAE